MTLLRKLVASQATLKVSNPEALHFRPKEMLRKVVSTCLNMYGNKSARADAFCAALADFFTGSFDVSMLDHASRIIRKHNILSPLDFGGEGVAQWVRLADSVRDAVEADKPVILLNQGQTRADAIIDMPVRACAVVASLGMSLAGRCKLPQNRASCVCDQE